MIGKAKILPLQTLARNCPSRQFASSILSSESRKKIHDKIIIKGEIRHTLFYVVPSSKIARHFAAFARAAKNRYLFLG